MGLSLLTKRSTASHKTSPANWTPLVPAAALLGFLLSSANLFAEEIYKVVDEEGNVSYSSEPPAEGNAAEVITPLPPPSEQDVQAAIQRQQDIEAEFERQDNERAEQARRQQEAQAQSGHTTVIQNTTIVSGGPGYRYGRYWHGAPVAPAAPTAPGYRPPHAVPLPEHPTTRPYKRRRP